ncbi:MAG: hypothetical protein Q8Q40_00945 [Methylococcaceae bacterium]|nr:hypothetical protein [Methylococcaceae bacterium]MDP3902526.1 hypothetical protein [Methylococcaceae bacterium]
MQVQAVKLDQGWYIKELPGFEEIKTDVIDIDVDLTPNQFHSLDYKELRGITIMERYFEKRQREVQDYKNITELQKKFRKQFGISSGQFSESIGEL